MPAGHDDRVDAEALAREALLRSRASLHLGDQNLRNVVHEVGRQIELRA
jgi:hypothetical protein